MLSKLLIWLGCLLFILHLSGVVADLSIYDSDDHDLNAQTSDDNAEHDDRYYYYDVDDTELQARRRARRQKRMPMVVAGVPAARGTVERATLTPRRERTQLRRRKKHEDESRRGRGSGRGWRRRGGSSVLETPAPVSTTTIPSTVDRQPSMTLTSASTTLDLVTRGSEVTRATVDSMRDRDVLMETISDDGDDIMILTLNNGTIINQRGMYTRTTML